MDGQPMPWRRPTNPDVVVRELASGVENELRLAGAQQSWQQQRAPQQPQPGFGHTNPNYDVLRAQQQFQQPVPAGFSQNQPINPQNQGFYPPNQQQMPPQMPQMGQFPPQGPPQQPQQWPVQPQQGQFPGQMPQQPIQQPQMQYPPQQPQMMPGRPPMGPPGMVQPGAKPPLKNPTKKKKALLYFLTGLLVVMALVSIGTAIYFFTNFQ